MGDNQLQTSFSVTLIFLNENDLKQDLPISSQHQELRLQIRGEADDICLTVNNDAGVCVFKFSITRDTECCRVATRSFLITLGCFSIIMRFSTQSEFEVFHRMLRSWHELRRHQPVFQQRTDGSSALQYFQFYGCLSQQQNMLQDYLRTATYQKAILLNDVDFRDKVVLDVGCGTGILSFFAVQAGAKKVYAVEGSSVAKYAEILVQTNNLSNKITVLSGKIEEVCCPEKVDVIISEPMGYMLLNERMLESYLHAKNWLKPKGMMFPTQGDIHLAPFTDEQLYMEHHARSHFWNQRCFYGVNLSGLLSSAVDEFFRQPIVDTFDMQVLMARSVKYTINFLEAKEEDLHRLEIPFVFKLLQSGLIHGLAFWFDVAFVGSRMTVWLSTAPNEPLTQWYQVRCLLQTPLFAKMGQTLSGRVHLIANKRQSYDIHITAVVDQSGFKSGNSLDLKNLFFRYA
ncbi:histone-arginine methyltransferase CARM1-like isoform X1 [Sinocyclocheilus rhinocerous]|uniref:histone-arginine methyltransferase CARM1-like isoform X1 n=2 Tax=Sinocyclocheilus rhinocerous TaxID=307959 RepID=UPI0007B8B1CC|nr:PREDICTED: histone-arginine methyltransferase CARM1-like isoform X1 [Sinocyclocheilus rhinocerous]